MRHMPENGELTCTPSSVFICDRIGRLWATRTLCVIWMVGIAMFMGSNGSLGMVYAGRFIAGLGIGQTPVVGPIYIAEVAPASIRGLCTCIFTGFVYLGIVLGYFANYGANLNISDTTHARWQVPASVHLIFAGIILTLSFFQCETPRYMIKQGNTEKAVEIMSRLRNLPPDHEYVQREIRDIINAHHEEKEATRGVGWFGVVKELFLIPSNLYRFMLVFFAQILSQWSGAGSITLYAVDLFSLLGISGSNETLLVTAVFGIVKLCSAVLCALFLVDYIGRKRSLLLGITMQSIAMIYIAGFLTSVWQLGVVSGYKLTSAQVGPSKGAIAMIYISGAGWALGWNSMQYLIGAEIFPLRIRAFANALGMAVHFANQYGNSRAVPNMLLPSASGGLSPRGTFWFFAGITILGGLWAFFFLPETGGRSLESMDRLFSLPWYKIGLYGNAEAEVLDEVHQEMEEQEMHKQAEAGGAMESRVERV
jgi:sugar porter (SP) family MFS transporter